MVQHSREVRTVVARLKRIVEEYKEEQPLKKRDWRTYEQQYYTRLRTCFAELSPLIKKAVKSIKIVRTEKRGNDSKLKLKQKVTSKVSPGIP